MNPCEYGHLWELEAYDLGDELFVNVWCDYCGTEVELRHEFL